MLRVASDPGPDFQISIGSEKPAIWRMKSDSKTSWFRALARCPIMLILCKDGCRLKITSEANKCAPSKPADRCKLKHRRYDQAKNLVCNLHPAFFQGLVALGKMKRRRYNHGNRAQIPHNMVSL